MLIKDIMTKNVSTLRPTDNLVTAARLMNDNDIGFLPVCEDGKIIGVVTDRDIVIKNIATGESPENTSVEDIMTYTVTVVEPEMEVEEASKLMARRQIRRIPVIIDDDRLVGVVALRDVVLNAQSDVEVADTLADISR